MKQIVKKGQTSYLAAIFIQDSSSSTGAGLTGLTSASAGLVCYRARSDDGNAGGTAITLSAGTRGTWSSGGFVEKDATNMPGIYELGIPDAALASGSNYAIVMLKGATNMAPLAIEFELVAFDPQDAVHLGLSSLPNVASGSAGAIPTTGTGANQIAVSSGAVTVGTNNDKTGYSLAQTFPTNFSALAITAGGAVTVGTNNDKTGYTASTVSDKTGYSLTQAFPTNFSSLSIDSNGNAATTSNIKKNTAKNGFMFVMTDSTTHAPKTGLTVTATRSLDGAAFASTTNAPTEVATGTYVINLSAADTNGDHVMLRFTATGADDLNIEIVTQP